MVAQALSGRQALAPASLRSAREHRSAAVRTQGRATALENPGFLPLPVPSGRILHSTVGDVKLFFWGIMGGQGWLRAEATHSPW